MPNDDLMSLIAEAKADAVFYIRFRDGTEETLMECAVWGEPDRRQCIGIVVHSGARSKRSPGEALVFGVDEVADVQVRDFEHFR
jgi:hypothetical protein